MAHRSLAVARHRKGLAARLQSLAVGYRLAMFQSLAALVERQSLAGVPQTALVALRKNWLVAARHSLALGAARHRETMAARRKGKGAGRMAAIHRQKRAGYSPVSLDHTNLHQRS